MALEELNDYTTLSRFTGLNPIRWLFEVERFFSLYAIYEEERFAYVVEYFDDEPFSWFNSWYRGPERLTWNSFTAAMLTTFPPVPNPPPNHTPSPEPFAPPPPPQPTRQTYTTNLPEPKHKVTPPPKPLQSPMPPQQLLPPSPTPPLLPPPPTSPQPLPAKITQPKQPPPTPPPVPSQTSTRKSTGGKIRPLALTFQPFNHHFHAFVSLPTNLSDLEGGRIDTCLEPYLRPPPWPDPYIQLSLPDLRTSPFSRMGELIRV